MELTKTAKRSKGTGTRAVYEVLRDEILTLKLAPSSSLDETTLAERFGMSRSPIREALIRLAGDGLVVALSNRTTLVAPFEITSLPKYLEALDLLQRVNTRLAAALRTPDDIERIKRAQVVFVTAVAEGDHMALSQANKDFHLAVAEAGKNPYLIRQYASLLDEGRRMLHLHFAYLEQSSEDRMLTDDHAEMIRAIEAQDAERAERLAHAHTRQFQGSFFKYLARNLGAEMAIVPGD